ncbi:hypothetical protein LCGC14_1827770 [marine sediment metagenome]|uniref:Uncharacterized protein n=1 Tax=marine sediment metagenome TaxID=412755 RepID=A0A0F9H554_9ZZZZ
MKAELGRNQLREILKLAARIMKEEGLEKEAALNEAYRRTQK